MLFMTIPLRKNISAQAFIRKSFPFSNQRLYATVSLLDFHAIHTASAKLELICMNIAVCWTFYFYIIQIEIIWVSMSEKCWSGHIIKINPNHSLFSAFLKYLLRKFMLMIGKHIFRRIFVSRKNKEERWTKGHRVHRNSWKKRRRVCERKSERNG